MKEFIELLFVSCLWIWGVNCLFSEDHLLENVGDWVYENMPVWVYKPTIGCAACMSSIHGILWFAIGFPLCFHDALPIRMLIPYLIVLCGLNFIIIKLTSKERIIKDEDSE